MKTDFNGEKNIMKTPKKIGKAIAKKKNSRTGREDRLALLQLIYSSQGPLICHKLLK